MSEDVQVYCDCSCYDCFGERKNDENSIQEPSIEEMRPLLHTEEFSQLPRKDFESLDYDRCYNKPYREFIQKQTEEQSIRKLEIIKWVVTFFVGLLTGLVALFIDSIVKLLSKWKFEVVDSSVMSCSEEGCLVVSLLLLLVFNVGFVIIASCLVVMEPVAGGSGIPEIKCYLNGIKVPKIGRLRTLVAKSIGVLFSVAGGLFVGKEGPMIHSGAIIGAGVPQFESKAFRKINFKQYSFFRTDRDKRDFVSGGAAAGVAAAFGAPIGGVLFSLEEGCSFWNQKLTWRTFFCSMAATYSLNFFLSGINTGSWGYFYLPGLINFGVFKCTNESGIGCHLWDVVDLLIFILMGFIGGIFGALFNGINLLLTKYRMKHVQTKHKGTRILEAVLVAAITTTVAFTAAMFLGECRLLPSAELNITNSVLKDTVRTYFCEEGYYNDMATLFFNSQEEAIKQLFHQEGKFSLRTLGLFFCFFFILACWTYGVNVPSGLFVPSLLCGAAYGRFVATLLKEVGYANEENSGTFALIGAAAFLGGVVRMTISLTVILIESTNEISYGLPLMLVLMVAKWSGDYFNEGLYDIHIKVKGVPLLEWEAPYKTEGSLPLLVYESTREYIDLVTGISVPADNLILKLQSEQIMEKSLHYVFPVTRVSSIIQLLRTTAHNVFPVVAAVRDSSSHNNEQSDDDDVIDCDEHSIPDYSRSDENKWRLYGLILRSTLVMMLKNEVMYREASQRTSQPKLSYEEQTAEYPRYPDIYDVLKNFSSDEDTLMDITPYMNPCPYTVYPNTPVPQVFSLFRSMGIRHLPVVDYKGQIRGIITRHNLTHEFLEECKERFEHSHNNEN